MSGTVRVTVPATSANLGPGFDALGLALGLHDVVEVEVIDDGLDVTVVGVGADTVALDETHLVVRAMRKAFQHIGWTPPGLAVRCRNAIPHGRGLGSSAAACDSSPALRARATPRPAASRCWVTSGRVLDRAWSRTHTGHSRHSSLPPAPRWSCAGSSRPRESSGGDPVLHSRSGCNP
jgi:hypothetical protein